VLPQAGAYLPTPRQGDYSLPGGGGGAKRALSQVLVTRVTSRDSGRLPQSARQTPTFRVASGTGAKTAAYNATSM